MVVYLPPEILMLILEFLLCGTDGSLIERVISVLNVAMACGYTKRAETYFWKYIVGKEIENEVSLKINYDLRRKF